MDISKELKIAMSTGKVEIGFKTSLKAINNKKAKLIIVASNIPEKMKSKIEAKCNNVPIYIFPGTSWELGSVCGRPHMVSTVAIIDPGESSILKIKEG
ncbi:MAG: 50S ribosomal protein L30e [Candidatus Methanomethylicota archaeon]|jgi:large subunit ribosomal protein L30e|uniref:Large ribosomal subunit protein eL30 n=1 Tax=Thermoproteota archaeon TaxID=2056631 RepID=A0A523BC19_9CREN|nr:50S ribosomal protein L30e [Candidatus Verstraetearchaeota archaeon]RZN56793.1 MAG: 50S ribosomal protein L30e [Candidatus Verstraetearchaeota archaeon]TDA38478.1 MAG: 50S ribosomal protein L30e [Candidatus Verstraetearchaeota archaeon]